MSEELEAVDGGDTYQGESPERWQERRALGIGASEAPAALGLSRWRTPLELYLRKRRETPPEPETADMLWGKVMEPAVVKLYEASHDLELQYPLPLVHHPQHPIVLATGDAAVNSERGIEIKTMQYWGFRKLQQDGLALAYPEYVVQAQQQMAVMGWKVVGLVVLVERTLHEYQIERDDGLIDDIICADLELWDRIESGNPPPIDFRRPDAYRAVQALWGGRTIADRTVPLSPGAAADWERAQELGRIAREANDEKKQLTPPIMAELIRQNATAGQLPSGRLVKLIQTGESTYTATRKASCHLREVAAPKSKR